MIDIHERGYVNGYIQRKANGSHQGTLEIESIDISPIEGVYFKEKGVTYLWLKRRPLLEYDYERQVFSERPREPRWEAYLKKQGDGAVAYKGEFTFLHFRFLITGVWDVVLGKDKQRLNLFVERLPFNEQTIINNINERKRAEQDEKR